MKSTIYNCDHCKREIGSDLSEARKNGALELCIAGKTTGDGNYFDRQNNEFCSIECASQFLIQWSKEILTQQILDK